MPYNLNTIIVEDEKPAARLLQRKLQKLGIQTHALLHSVQEALMWFEKNEAPDLIFLDIQLSDGLAFEIFEKIEIKSAIIFTTAFDDYALRAFKLNSVDYILKPIDNEELENAIVKFKNRLPKNNLSLNLSELKTMLTKPFVKRFTVKIGLHLKVILTDEIECFYSENKSTYIYTFEKRNYLIDGSLDALESILNPADFYRINRKMIVSIKSIKEIVSYNNARLKIILPNCTEKEALVSREKVNDFKHWITQN